MDPLIDVDFTDIPEGEGTGLIEETHDEIMMASGDVLGSFEDTYPKLMIPKHDRKAIAELQWPKQRRTIRQIYSQGRTSACVGFGSAQALEVTRTRRYGNAQRVALSGMSVYREIGRTLMSGAMISDGMKQIVSTGALPLSTLENDAKYDVTLDRLDYSGRIDRNWEEHAAPFRVSKWATARGSDEIESALLNNFCGIVGRSRHCVPFVGLTWRSNTPCAAYANSWSSNWGDQGIGYDTQRVYRNLTLYLILEVVVNEDLSFPEL
mgnify:CR=1 FL=1